VTNEGVRDEMRQGQMRSDIKQSNTSEIKAQYAQA
jgi:hypothetical protein